MRCPSGHYLEATNVADGGYKTGWVCDRCLEKGKGGRWVCVRCCYDMCFTCLPRVRGLPDGVQEQTFHSHLAEPSYAPADTVTQPPPSSLLDLTGVKTPASHPLPLTLVSPSSPVFPEKPCCTHYSELQQLRQRVTQLEQENEALRVQQQNALQQAIELKGLQELGLGYGPLHK
eukprot:TRINITY_DN4321_c1_g2_i1.p1 TRINITY_DN4321_c1_g2~~TRINITY_DN4321_c1_g2_i1.p1  ORF type:complete len:188 (+),score=24.45 TRINITY_DN4321_c1_g2_i1:43-564(+)